MTSNNEWYPQTHNQVLYEPHCGNWIDIESSALCLHRLYSYIYADRPCTNNSLSSFYIPATTAKRKFRLSHRSSSTVSEYYAILCLLRHIKNIWTTHCRVILTDSQIVLMSIEVNNSDSSCTAPLAYSIILAYLTALESGHSAVLEWMPGHCRIIRSVESDCLDREAHTLISSDLVLCSTGDIRIFIRLTGRCCKEECFNTRSLQSNLYPIDPNLLNTHTRLKKWKQVYIFIGV